MGRKQEWPLYCQQPEYVTSLVVESHIPPETQILAIALIYSFIAIP